MQVEAPQWSERAPETQPSGIKKRLKRFRFRAVLARQQRKPWRSKFQLLPFPTIGQRMFFLDDERILIVLRLHCDPTYQTYVT
mmetsp:Transcript_23040/g.73783  ORF Transcript_23040/g.73783 Transcript_23040/m.73783 type:complete len:83 (-) Transcript_23040:827-1075(-)